MKVFDKVKAAIQVGTAAAILTAGVTLVDSFWPDLLTQTQENSILTFLAAVGGLFAAGAAYLKTENTGYSKVKQPDWEGDEAGGDAANSSPDISST